MSLAQQTLSGFLWTLSSRMGSRISIFVVGIILARLLTPEDFGLVAMLGVFFSVSSSLVDSGFSNALIREKVITNADKSTAFTINLIISIALYIILWFSSPSIASFFNQPQLVWLTRIMGLDLIFKALSIVQRAVFMHSFRFKHLTIIDVSASILSGLIAVFLAFRGLGVWALAIKYFLFSLFASTALWIVNPWKPTGLIFKESFNRLFGFGSKLLITGIINAFFTNVYNLVIGKFFSPAILGFYNRAHTFSSQTVSSILIALQQVTYPILSKTRDNPERLKAGYRRVITSISFVNIPLAVILGFSAKPLILILLGDKWAGAIPFLQLLSVSVLVNHISAINQNLFKVVGRSDIYLRVSLINKAFAIIAILIGIQFGIWGLVIASVIAQYLEVFVVMFFTSKQINYSISEQLKDVLPIFILVAPLVLFLTLIIWLKIESDFINLFIMGLGGVGLYLFLAFKTNSIAFYQIKNLAANFLKK